MIPNEYVKRLPELLASLQEKMTRSSGGAASINTSVTNAPGTSAADTSAPAAKEQLVKVPSTGNFVSEGKLDEELAGLVDRLSRHYPFHEPFYVGQMLKPPHPAAWLAYALAMTINPNNHALDGGPEASFMEKEVIGKMLDMVGFPDTALGHLTSSGTIANLEALWVARELHPERPIAVSNQAHYTHKRMAQVLRHPVMMLQEDQDGLPDPGAMDLSGPLPGTVVVTMGTTGQGRVEPLHRILPWAREHGVRVHVDAAYGGFFHLLRNSGLIASAPWEVLAEADSLVIDPHKHGLQPYGCGAVLFRDPEVGRFYRHDSPYTYFTSEELHLGEISLECSRAGSAAVALWFTLQLLLTGKAAPEDAEDGLPLILADCRKAALELHEQLEVSDRFMAVMKPELDIVTYIPVTRELTFSAVSRLSAELMHGGMNATDNEDRLYLSTLVLNRDEALRRLPELTADQDHVRVLRSVLMKPEHLGFIPEMMRRLHRLHDAHASYATTR